MTATSAAPKQSGQFDAWDALIGRRGSFGRLYSFEPLKRIAMVKEGAPSALIPFLADGMAITRDRLYRITGVARATVDRKIHAGLRLSQDETERMLGVALLIGHAEKIVSESGESSKFDAGKWIATWLDRPNAALGGRCPSTLMDTFEGRDIVSTLLAQMQSGAYA
ncbi:MAG: antitoxin Xre/MbcA/ParS toxin-binding domain-containing protein [Gemmatimonadaceae bacterium]